MTNGGNRFESDHKITIKTNIEQFNSDTRSTSIELQKFGMIYQIQLCYHSISSKINWTMRKHLESSTSSLGLPLGTGFR